MQVAQQHFFGERIMDHRRCVVGDWLDARGGRAGFRTEFQKMGTKKRRELALLMKLNSTDSL